MFFNIILVFSTSIISTVYYVVSIPFPITMNVFIPYIL